MISYFLLALFSPLSKHAFVKIPHKKQQKKNSYVWVEGEGEGVFGPAEII